MSLPVYTFDAPNFINFQALHEQYDHNADSWFDHTMDAENIPPQQERTSLQQNKTPGSKANLPRAVVTPVMRSDNSCVDPQETKACENMAASLENWRTTSKNASAHGVSAVESQPRRASRRLSLQQKRQQLAKIRDERRTITTPTRTEEHPPMKKPKLISRRGKRTEACVNKGPRADGPSAKSKARLPLPVTPMVMKRKPLNSRLKSTEELEVERMLQLQQEVMAQRRKNEESLKAAIAGAGQPVKTTTSQVTQAVDFHFRTDDRLKRHPVGQSGDEYKEVDFLAALRRHPSSPARVPKGGHTVPKPFNLFQGNKRKLEPEPCVFVSTAEQIEAFYKHTPSRYHLRSRQQENEGPSPLKCGKAKLTNPRTPRLETKQRHRPVTCKSTVELEAEELEKQQQYKFHAQELDPRVLDGGLILPKKPSVKEPTKAIGFNLELEKRIQEREAKREEPEEEKFTFHSRPCPARILEEVVGVPEKKPLVPTVPKSPAFALKNRVRRPVSEEEQEALPVMKANPMPHYGVPFKPKVPEQRQMEPAPFSFDSRDQERLAQKEKKLEELRKAEVPTFKAIPVPDFDQISLPERKVKTPTQLEPFHLQIEERAAKKTLQWKHQIQEELKQQKEAACFKARPNHVIHREPFVPKRDSRMLSVMDSFELATEKRAKERQEFEKRIADIAAQKEMMEEEERLKKEEQEKDDVAQMRHDMGMSQEAANARAEAPACPGAPGEESPKLALHDGVAGDLQYTAAVGVCPSSEELKQKTSPGTPGRREADPTTKARSKEVGKESINVAAPKKDGTAKARALDETHPDTRATGAPETGENRDGSETRTLEGTKKKTPQGAGALLGSKVSSGQQAPGPRGPAVTPVARNGQVSEGPGGSLRSARPKKGEDGSEKEGKATSPAEGTAHPPEPGCNSIHRSDQGQENDMGDQKKESPGQQMLPQKDSTSTEQKTTGPPMSGQDGGDTVGREISSRIEAVPPPASGLAGDTVNTQPGTELYRVAEFFQVIDDTPPPSAPFPHRSVTLRPGDVNAMFHINTDEMLGGGRFGDVHTCTEKSTGLPLVAKVIKIQEKEMALNEVAVMNQLNHLNLIQMFDALETPSNIFLFLEFVEGGELFERIIDENYHLTEMDAMVFVRQICEGIYYMHQMYVLHLDLKPENIVCVSQTGHMVKIIDFGLARRYKPREKLRISFGTPEFVAPEVVNFEFISFPTDMWSLGVITYMMLSGLSPFLGDNDTETMNNVLSSDVDFNEEPFENVSDEGKEFICNLLIKEKSGRLSAAQCLRHPWLNDLAEKAKRCKRLLKSQIELRKYMMRRRWKKNFFAVTAANRFKKISSSTSLATLEM